MDDRIVVITGGNSGIGFETALALASMGAHLVLACRNPDKASSAVAELRTRSGNDSVENRQLDLGDLESVQKFVQDVSDLDRIDVLINNAGLVRDERDETAQGFEMVFGTNHMGHFLLTDGLLDHLRASSAGRIVNVASFGHTAAFGGIQWSKIQRYTGFHEWRTYGESKLANILHAEALASRLEGSNIVAHSLHPGSVYTNFGRDGDTRGVTGWLMDLELGPVRQSVLKTPAQGAATSIHVASSAEAGRCTGQYWSNSKVSSTAPWSRRRGDAEELWHNSRRLLATVL